MPELVDGGICGQWRTKVYNIIENILKSEIEVINIVTGKTGTVLTILCVCGKEFKAKQAEVRRGNTKSCGCLTRDNLSKALIKHGHRVGNAIERATYESWHSMKGRCNNPNVSGYKYYGGKGISYDVKWEYYIGFLADMGLKPSIEYVIDRINPRGNYTKRNCRWITKSENSKRAAIGEYQ